MKVLLDVGISPRLRLPLQTVLGNTPVESAVFNQWRTLRDDELLTQASLNGFTTLVTTDKQLGAQQRHPYIAVIAVDDDRLTALRDAVTDRAAWIPAFAGMTVVAATPSVSMASIPRRRESIGVHTAGGGRASTKSRRLRRSSIESNLVDNKERYFS